MDKGKATNDKATKVATDGAKVPEVTKEVADSSTEDLTSKSEGTILVMDIPVRAKTEAEYNLWKTANVYANTVITDLKFTDDRLMLLKLEMRRIVVKKVKN